VSLSFYPPPQKRRGRFAAAPAQSAHILERATVLHYRQHAAQLCSNGCLPAVTRGCFFKHCNCLLANVLFHTSRLLKLSREADFERGIFLFNSQFCGLYRTDPLVSFVALGNRRRRLYQVWASTVIAERRWKKGSVISRCDSEEGGGKGCNIF